MKYIEVNSWGNERKHFIPLNKIVDFNFDDEFTTISLANGKSVNVIEDESIIKGMLDYHGVELITEEQLSIIAANQEAYQEYGGFDYFNEDELPF